MMDLGESLPAADYKDSGRVEPRDRLALERCGYVGDNAVPSKEGPMKKFILAVGAGVGFILGSRAGRGPYEQLAAKARKIHSRDDVQDAVEKVKRAVASKAHLRGAVADGADAAGEQLGDLTATLAGHGAPATKLAPPQGS
jgi:hypothetical protein